MKKSAAALVLFVFLSLISVFAHPIGWRVLNVTVQNHAVFDSLLRSTFKTESNIEKNQSQVDDPEFVNVITSVGTAFTENFDSMENSSAAALPNGFKIGPDWATGTTVTTVAYGTTGTGAVTGSSGGGTVNWGNGVTGSSLERALGFLNSSGFTSPRSITLKLTNSTGVTISNLSISFDYEKYRSGSRQFDWTFFHGSSTNPSTSNSSGDQSYPADANNTTISNPPVTVSKTVNLSGLSIPNGGDYYLRWTLTGLGGSTNGQGLGIDNFTITAGATSAPTKLAITNISPTNPTAGSGFNVTVQSQDASSVASNVSADTGFTLSNTGGGTIGGTTSGTILAGTNSVVVNGVTLSTAENGVTLTATRTSGDTLDPGTSAPFNVLAPADHIAFVNVPSTGTANANLATFSVEARRPDNSVDTNYTGNVTITKATGPGTLSGTTTKAAVAGVATFNDLKFDLIGTYTINADSGSFAQITSGEIAVSDNSINTDHFRTVQSGDWNTLSTWESSHNGTDWIPATLAPDNLGNTITVRNGHTVTIGDVTHYDQLTVEAGAQVTVLPLIQTTLQNGTGTDLVINGTWLNQGGTWTTNGTWTVGAGGTYIHNTTSGIATPLGQATLDTASTFIYRGSSTLSTSLSISGRTYGNLVFESSLGSYSPTSNTGTSALTVNGTLSVGMSGAGTVFYNTTGFTGAINVAGSLSVGAGSSLSVGNSATAIGGSVTTGGSSTLAIGNSLSVGGNWTNGGGFTHNNNAVTFNGTGAQSIATGGTGAGKSFAAVVVNKASGTATLAGPMSAASIDVQGGTFDTSAANSYAVTPSGAFTIGATGTFNENDSTVTVGGNWSNLGTFNAGTGSSNIFNGTGPQSFTGSSTFRNLSITTSTPRTITFAAGSTQAANGSLTMTGTAGNLLSLRSSVGGSQWNLNAPSTQSVAYVDVQDSNANGGQLINQTNSVDSGNNLNWNFVVLAPEINVTPASMTFGTQPQGSTSGTRSVTINNTGTGALNIDTLVKGGDNAADFTIISDPSNTVIPAGGNAKVIVTFTPAAVGLRTAQITIPNDDADEDPVIVSLSGTGTAAGTPAAVKSLWVWNATPNPVTDPAGRAMLLERSLSRGITDIYLNVLDGSNVIYPAADIAAVIDGAHDQGQRVWYVSGDAAWLTQPCNATASSYQRMLEVINYNNSVGPTEKFDGVMLDVEPGGAFNLTTYANLHQCLRGVLPAEIKLGTAISAFWHSPDQPNVEYPTGGETKSPAEHIIDLPLDQIVVMGYRDTSVAIIDLDEEEIAYASSIGKAGLVLAGLETKDVLPTNITFFQEGEAAMTTESAAVAANFASSVGFGGFSIHAYKDAYLGGTPNWPAPPTVATNAATLVTSSTATLNGSANPNGAATTAWFRYSTTNPVTCNDSFGTRAPVSDGLDMGSGSIASPYSVAISGLSGGTEYYFCAIAQNSHGMRFGGVAQFTTAPTPQFQLNVARSGAGTGGVTSSPAGINCGSTCSASFDDGTVVDLTATPSGGSTFAGWSGDCTGTGACQLTMSQARSVTAQFNPPPTPTPTPTVTPTPTPTPQFLLSVSKSGAGTGTVTSLPAGINCGSTCSASFDDGTVVDLTASPSGGSTFAGWSGDCTGTGACQLTMSQARNVNARFEPPDTTPPVISYTPLTNVLATGDRTLSVTVTDDVGVAEVNIAWENNGSPTPVLGVCVFDSGTTWTCEIDADEITSPMTNPGTVSYVVTAKDAANNSSSNPAGGIRNLFTVGNGGFIDTSVHVVFDTVQIGSGWTFSGDARVETAITIDGNLDMGANTLTIGCNGGIFGTGPFAYVIGAVEKEFCSPGTFIFPVGTVTDGSFAGTGEGGVPVVPEYSPFTATITGGTAGSSLTVSAIDGFMPGTFNVASASRWWQVTETGDLTADISFTYLDQDIAGHEPFFKVIRSDGVAEVYIGGSVNATTNTGSAPGVSEFSGWAAGNLIPTSSLASVSGRVTTASGRGISNVRLSVLDMSGNAVGTALTNTFGYYIFDGLTVGQSYSVSVRAKRYTFTTPTVVISLKDNIDGLDFVASP